MELTIHFFQKHETFVKVILFFKVWNKNMVAARKMSEKEGGNTAAKYIKLGAEIEIKDKKYTV
jgi:hypothetical protein